jgi:hypothetical protein
MVVIKSIKLKLKLRLHLLDKTVVVNKYRDQFDVYIGRGSLLGNPYNDGTRKENIEKYREWFYNRLKKPNFRSAVNRLKGKRLGCFCKPKDCHGDVIVEYLERK